MYSALKINGNSERSIQMDLHLARNDQKVNNQVNSDDTGGKKKGTVLKEFAKRARSELETAPYKPAEVPSGIFHSHQKRMGNIPEHRYFGEHLITGLLEVDCSCWGGEVGAQDHSLPSHRDIRCE